MHNLLISIYRKYRTQMSGCVTVLKSFLVEPTIGETNHVSTKCGTSHKMSIKWWHGYARFHHCLMLQSSCS